jgi:hypothetical protein
MGCFGFGGRVKTLLSILNPSGSGSVETIVLYSGGIERL